MYTKSQRTFEDGFWGAEEVQFLFTRRKVWFICRKNELPETHDRQQRPSCDLGQDGNYMELETAL